MVGSVKRAGDIVIASLHWGGNWGFSVPEEHVRFAHGLIQAGVDLVHGHSSHHVRPIEVFEGKLILYGCGDFLNDYEGIGGYEEFRDDLALMYLPAVDGFTGRLIDLCLAPMRIRHFRANRSSRKRPSGCATRSTAKADRSIFASSSARTPTSSFGIDVDRQWYCGCSEDRPSRKSSHARSPERQEIR